jgi:hypothetical protein
MKNVLLVFGVAEEAFKAYIYPYLVLLDETYFTKTIALLVVIRLLLHCYSELERVRPTSENVEKDIQLRHPWPIRAIGYFVGLLPWQPWDLSDADALLEQGAKDAGLPPDYSSLVVEAIHKFCDSLKSNNVQINLPGRKNLHFIITSGLSQYLQLHQLAREKPELLKAKLNNPIFIVGLPRSGTTHLHKILSESSSTETMSIPLWQHFFPVPPKTGPDLRRLNYHLLFYWWKYIANRFGLDSIHMARPDLPDECHFSLRLAGASVLLWNMAPVHDYLSWLINEADEHIRHSYETYRIVLQLLQASQPEKRFVLKCPTHSLNIKILKEAIPEACLIITHRDPCRTTLSYCSLNIRTQATGCEEIEWMRTVQAVIHKYVVSSERLVNYIKSDEAKSKGDGRTIFHVSYKKLVSHPTDLVGDIHKHFGLHMTAEHERRITNYTKKNAQHSKGIHRYSHDGLELKKDDLEKKFVKDKKFFAEYLLD